MVSLLNLPHEGGILDIIHTALVPLQRVMRTFLIVMMSIPDTLCWLHLKSFEVEMCAQAINLLV